MMLFQRHFSETAVETIVGLLHLAVKKYPNPTTHPGTNFSYCKIYNIRRTNSQNLNDYHIVLSNQLKLGVKPKLKMQLEQHQQAMPQLHLGD